MRWIFENILYGLPLLSIALGVKVVLLEQQNPSYVFHGTSLATEKNITMYTSSGTTFILDYGTRYCRNENGPNQVAPPPENRVTCYDKLPFLINGKYPDYRFCKGIYAIDFSLQSFVFACRLEINAESLKITYQSPVVDASFAVSVKVKEWVDERYQTYLMPELVTFRAGVLFTLYVKRGDMWILVPVGYSGVDDAAQPGVLVSVQTLGSPETLLSLYSGGDPGLTPSDDNFLINITGNMEIQALSAATTILVYSPAAVGPLGIMFNRGHGLTYKFASPGWPQYLLNSPEIPELWIEQQHCFQQVLWNQPGSDSHYIFNFPKLRSGNLTMHVIGKNEGSYTFAAQDEGQNSTLLAQDLQLTFCPASTNSKFVLLIGEDNVFPTPSVECEMYFELNHTMSFLAIPIDALHGSKINQLCFQSKLTSKSTEIEMCAYNSFAQFPFRLDGKRLERTACTKIIFVGSLHLYCCSITASYIPGLVHTIYFDDHDLEDLAGNVLLIGLSDYETIVFNEVYQPSYITLPEVLDRDILVVVVSSYWLYSATTHAEFSELRWARPTKPCQYQLFSTEGFTKNESALLVFDDNDPFQNQPLTSELYFILVPRGCQPTIAVAPKTSQSFAIYHQCEGSVFATAPGYKTRFHSAIPAYDYNTTWLCDAFQIDITIELLDLVNGDLTLAIRNLTDETVPGGMLNYDPASSQPQNLTFQNVRSVQILWHPPGDIQPMASTGFFLRIHFKKRWKIVATTPRSSLSSNVVAIFCYIMILLLL